MSPGAGELFGVRWTSWVDQKAEVAVESWRGDEDLLAHTASGQPLPVGQLADPEVLRPCGRGHAAGHTARRSAAAGAGDDQPRGGLLLRDHAGAGRFVAGDQRRRLLRPGPARAGRGAAALGNTRQLTAGETPPDDPTAWKRVAGAEEALSTDYPVSPRDLPGRRAAAGGQPRRRRSVGAGAGRPPRGRPVRGLDFARVDDKAGSLGSLIQEIWRLFWSP